MGLKASCCFRGSTAWCFNVNVGLKHLLLLFTLQLIIICGALMSRFNHNILNVLEKGKAGFPATVTPCFLFSRDVSVELPFILMHPKPPEPPASRPQSGESRVTSAGSCTPSWC